MKKLYRIYVLCMLTMLLVSIFIFPAFAVDDMWTVASKIIKDVYGKIAGISTILAGLWYPMWPVPLSETAARAQGAVPPTTPGPARLLLEERKLQRRPRPSRKIVLLSGRSYRRQRLRPCLPVHKFMAAQPMFNSRSLRTNRAKSIPLWNTADSLHRRLRQRLPGQYPGMAAHKKHHWRCGDHQGQPADRSSSRKVCLI